MYLLCKDRLSAQNRSVTFPPFWRGEELALAARGEVTLARAAHPPPPPPCGQTRACELERVILSRRDDFLHVVADQKSPAKLCVTFSRLQGNVRPLSSFFFLSPPWKVILFLYNVASLGSRSTSDFRSEAFVRVQFQNIKCLWPDHWTEISLNFSQSRTVKDRSQSIHFDVLCHEIRFICLFCAHSKIRI